MFTYWELYIAYVNRCVEDNWKNDIDPHHYEMEWNHWLPRACFPDIKLGQYLTLRQHAIASALQSLALNENCMCGWHKKHLPEVLLELAWPIYGKACAKRLHSEKDEFGRSITGVKLAEKTNAEKDAKGRSIHGVKAAERLHSDKDERGKSVQGVKNAERLHKEKDEFGRSLHTLRLHEKKDEQGRSLQALKLHEERDELGRSVHSVKASEKAHAKKDELGRSVTAVKAGKAAALKKRRRVQLTRIEDGEVFTFDSTLLAAETLKINGGNIANVCNGNRKTVSGYTAIYLDSK